MPKTEKKYPEWVQKQRKTGTTVKEKGGKYYLYKRTSRRVPGKKYPQPVDTYIGVITPEGVIESGRRKVTVTDIEVLEYGFSESVIQLCPEDWKKAVGEDWEEFLWTINRGVFSGVLPVEGKEHQEKGGFPPQLRSPGRFAEQAYEG